ncbi:MAG: valine--tRNA ligase [Bacteroidia bacterium]|nr:valine--tRNA ligase [Bacteroidia bacterium]
MISTKYSPAEIEDKWYQFWIEKELFKSVPDSRTPSYTVVIPPPNVTGVLHMGHMLNNTIQDVLIRRKRMQGYNACWVPGTDHASIATEAKVVQMLRERGIKKSEIGRTEFLKYAFEWKEKYGGIILQQLRKLGASCDWERTTFTMDDHYYKAVTDTFIDLYDKGFIYRGLRMVNWDCKAMTAVSDEEVIYHEAKDKLYYVKYCIEGSSEFLTVATTRPETIMADTALAVHPEDERFKQFAGKKVIVPLVNRVIPIITDEYVDREFGTGCLKITPAHDKNDYEIGLKYDLPVIDIIDFDGKLNEGAEFCIGMDREDARKKVAEMLSEQGLLLKAEDYIHSVGFSERTGEVIEPKLSMQWFLRMKEICQPALKAVIDGEVNLIPHNFINTYRYWMENVKDWCLSRQLWWGQQIPAWYAPDGRVTAANSAAEAAEKLNALLDKANEDKSKYVTAEMLTQDEDVLDTWASSWLWPIEVFKGISSPDNEEFNYYYPTNDLVTAPEILFFWVARMIIAGYEYTGKKPFENVYLTGIVRDKLRRKMSKSLGNSPDALKLIEDYGADGVRMGMLLCSPAGNDILYDDELIAQGRNFANKIWNGFRLVSGWQTEDRPMNDIEENAVLWFESRLNEVLLELNKLFGQFRLSEALMTIYKLIWDDFCSSYLEMVKPPYGSPVSAQALSATAGLFEELMKLLHPFMPFLTEEIYQNLAERNGGSVCVANYPEGDPAKVRQSLLTEMNWIQQTIAAVRAFRAAKQISPKESIVLYIKTDDKALYSAHQNLLNKFLNTSEIQFVADKVAGTSSFLVGTHEFFIPLTNIDVEAEKDKIEKEIVYLEGFLESIMKKLGNERFVANAKPEVVEAENKKKADTEQKLTSLRQNLSSLS